MSAAWSMLLAAGMAGAPTCQTGRAETPAIATPVLIFVWPDYATADTLTKEGIERDVEQHDKDRPYSLQLRRISAPLVGLGAATLRCSSGAARFTFARRGKKRRVVDLRPHAEWRGSVAYCPGREPMVRRGVVPDEDLLAFFQAWRKRS